MSGSQSRPSFSVHDLTPNMTCDRTFITSNTTDAASGVHPSLLVGFVLFSVHCCVVFCRPLFVLYSCSFWPLYCMSFILVLFGHYIVCPLYLFFFGHYIVCPLYLFFFGHYIVCPLYLFFFGHYIVCPLYLFFFGHYIVCPLYLFFFGHYIVCPLYLFFLAIILYVL